MLRRSSLPSRAFNSPQRDRRLSVPSSPPPLPPPRRSRPGFVRVKVSDFVAAPSHRRSQPRNALGPVDVAKRPPCYDLRGNLASHCQTEQIPLDHVFEISDREHIDRLRSIISTSQDSLSDGNEAVVEIVSLDESPVECDDQPNYGDDTLKEKFCDTHVKETFEEQLYRKLEAIEESETYDRHDDSDQELAHTYDDLREYDDESEVEEQIDPDLDFDKDASSASFIIASISEEDTTVTSVALSTSSVADTSLSEFPTIASINTTEGNSETPCSVPPGEEEPSVVISVESSECLVDKKKSLPSFMRRKVPSPVKYTFRPLHRVPSKTEKPSESDEVMAIAPSEYPQRLTADIAHNLDTSSDSSNSHEELSRTKSPTPAVANKALDRMEPQSTISITHIPPLSLAAVGLFRKKRDSEDSIWSRRSDASSRRKRESDESTQSSNTEYYEDDYTKFIVSKNSSPRSPLRLRNHPYFARIVSGEEGLKFSRSGFRRNSSVSVSTSDEEYTPLSTVTHSSNFS